MNSYTEEMKGRTNMLTLDKFEEASEKVKEVTLETKLIYSDFLSDQTGNKVYLKPENMQFTGAYKVRGAYYKMSTLKPCAGCCVCCKVLWLQGCNRDAYHYTSYQGKPYKELRR